MNLESLKNQKSALETEKAEMEMMQDSAEVSRLEKEIKSVEEQIAEIESAAESAKEIPEYQLQQVESHGGNIAEISAELSAVDQEIENAAEEGIQEVESTSLVAQELEDNTKWKIGDPVENYPDKPVEFYTPDGMNKAERQIVRYMRFGPGEGGEEVPIEVKKYLFQNIPKDFLKEKLLGVTIISFNDIKQYYGSENPEAKRKMQLMIGQVKEFLSEQEIHENLSNILANTKLSYEIKLEDPNYDKRVKSLVNELSLLGINNRGELATAISTYEHMHKTKQMYNYNKNIEVINKKTEDSFSAEDRIKFSTQEGPNWLEKHKKFLRERVEKHLQEELFKIENTIKVFKDNFSKIPDSVFIESDNVVN